MTHSTNVGAIHSQESVDQNSVGRSSADGSWQKESPYKEELELLRNVLDLQGKQATGEILKE